MNKHTSMKTFSLILMLAAIPFALCAQQTARETAWSGGHADMNTERLVKELALNQEQARTVGDINDRFAEQLAELKERQDLSKEDLRPKRRALFQERDAELQKALTPEQWKHLQELREQWKIEKKAAKEQGPKKGGEPRQEHNE